LVKQNFISQNAFDTADAAHRAQVAAVAAAQAQLDRQAHIERCSFHAPIGGLYPSGTCSRARKCVRRAADVIVDLAQLEVQAQQLYQTSHR